MRHLPSFSMHTNQTVWEAIEVRSKIQVSQLYMVLKELHGSFMEYVRA